MVGFWAFESVELPLKKRVIKYESAEDLMRFSKNDDGQETRMYSPVDNGCNSMNDIAWEKVWNR